MNQQPYGLPPRWWEPKLTPGIVRLSRGLRNRILRHKQRLVRIRAQGVEHLERSLAVGYGVLITPNHSAHYDWAALYSVADQIRQPLYFLTAWQVFSTSSRFHRWLMQRIGCFSIDRENSDRQAYRKATQILREEPHPLVIFPEGEIYHVNDRTTPFHQGAGSIALGAARRAPRPIVMLPCAIKLVYR